MDTFKEADSSMYNDKLRKTNSTKNAMVRSLLSTIRNKSLLTDDYTDQVKEMPLPWVKK